MGTETQQPPDADRLESWKAIAGYLGRDVRTVQRWERTEGLPVHRHVHGERGSVHALRSEIDAWRAARDVASAPPAARAHARRWQVVVGAALAVVALTVTGWWRLHAGPAGAVHAPLWDPPRVLASAIANDPGVRTVRLPGPGRVGDLVLSPDGTRLFATQVTHVSVVDTAAMSVIRAFSVEEPSAVVPSRDGRRAFIGLTRGDILVLDMRTMEVRRVVTHARVKDVALAHDGRTLYLAGEFAGLLAIDTETDAVRSITRIPCPERLATAPAAPLLFVGYECGGPGGRDGHDTIEVVDTSTGATARLITGLAAVSGRMAVSPDGAQLWADGRNACISAEYDHVGCPAPQSGILNVVRAGDGTLLRALPIGTPEHGETAVSFTPDGMRAIVGNATTQVLDTVTLAAVESAPVAMHAPVVFSPDRTTAYAAFGDDAAVSALPMPRAPRPPDGLTGRWLADGTANDAVGTAHGRAEGGFAYAQGRVGQAFRFDGNGALVVSDVGNLGIHAHAFTLSMWLRLDADGPMTIADRLTSGSGDRKGWVLFRTRDGRLAACFAGPSERCGGTASVQEATGLGRDRWQHVALVFTGTSAVLYVDGRFAAQAAVNGHVDSNEAALRFGGATGSERLRGLLDEIEIYDRVLTADEIRSRREAASR